VSIISRQKAADAARITACRKSFRGAERTAKGELLGKAFWACHAAGLRPAMIGPVGDSHLYAAPSGGPNPMDRGPAFRNRVLKRRAKNRAAKAARKANRK
jgi:hypothetical protein